MKIQKIPRNTEVRESALPYYFEGGPAGVLLIHGWTGYSGQLAYLGRKLNEAGFTVSIPRLPGHGTNAKDLLQSGWKQWLRHAFDAYLDLSARCEKVYIGGHSMGGVIALILAATFKPEKIALYAPAVYNSDPMIRITPLMQYFLRGFPIPCDTEPQNADEEVFCREYWSYRYISTAAWLYKLQKISRKRLPEVTSESLIIVSKEDLTVPANVAGYIERMIGSENVRQVTLAESSHILVDDVERERVAEESIAWFTAANVPGRT